MSETPWEFVQDAVDVRRGVARVLTVSNELVCETTPERADLIVCAVNCLVVARTPEVLEFGDGPIHPSILAAARAQIAGTKEGVDTK